MNKKGSRRFACFPFLFKKQFQVVLMKRRVDAVCYKNNACTSLIIKGDSPDKLL